jgi:putative transposase
MKQSYPEYWPQYFTSTIYEWKHLLNDDKNKDILIESLKFLADQKKIVLNAFVIMSNHFHSIWQPLFGFNPPGIQASFLKHTAQELKHSMELNNQELLDGFLVNKADRKYQIWKRRPLNVELRTPAVFNQKLDYIHYNPVKAGLCANPEEYYYSSARFYHDGTDDFGILTHYSGN